MKKVFIQTFGCQMNERDSENMMGLLARQNFVQTALPDEADLILVNTCSIREHAVDKAASQLGRLAQMKTAGRLVRIGVTGCLAQQEGEKLLKRFPFLDFALGPDAIPRLRTLLREMDEKPKNRILDTRQDLTDPTFVHEYLPYSVTRPEWQGRKVKAYVIISKGCDFRCTFCVVPNTRGPERSASPDEILAEVKGHADRGVREVSFLGQNVNSYGKNSQPVLLFSDLLRRVEAHIPATSPLQRFRFTTSHPVDLGEDLMRCFAELPRLCSHLHLPVQSGADAVLRRMKRLYTIADYRKRIRELRTFLPGISLTTDIIVGFPGETEEDFRRTLDFVQEVGYTNLYAFKYSSRPYTPAQRLRDDVTEEVKSERLGRILALQREVSRRQNQALVGETMEVLIEGINRRGEPAVLTGRTPCNRLVHFESPTQSFASVGKPESWIGKLVSVRVEEGLDNSLRGVFVGERDR